MSNQKLYSEETKEMSPIYEVNFAP